jgi:hypothetical protein
LGTRYFATALDIFVTAGASAKLAISLLRTLWEARKTGTPDMQYCPRERRGMNRDAMDRPATAYSKCRVPEWVLQSSVLPLLDGRRFR